MCIEKKYFKPILLASIAATIASFILHNIGSLLTMDYYANPAYSAIWSKIMMPAPGPPPLSFFIYALAFGLVECLIFASAYAILMKSIPGKTKTGKGLNYGALLFLLSNVPGSLAMYLLLSVPAVIIGIWAVEGLVVMLVSGLIFAKMIK